MQAATDSIVAGLSHTGRLIDVAERDLSFGQLDNIQRQLEMMIHSVRAQKANHLMAELKERIATLGHPDAPDFGKQFVAGMDAHGFSVRLDEKLSCNATYTSYSYAPQKRGFVNEIAVNPERVDDRNKFFLSLIHEYIHGLQKHASPALQHSPFNPDTRVIVHPADWIMLEMLCERDAFTKEAFINMLLARDTPDAGDISLIHAREMEHAIASAPSLADAVVGIALGSLSRPCDRSHPHGKNFIQHYQEVAIKNFSGGMGCRRSEHESGHIFVRLELNDFWQVGNYGVAPNSFGEYIKEPLIAERPPLSRKLQERFDQMCEEYNIPPVDRCSTLREYTNHGQQHAAITPALAAA